MKKIFFFLMAVILCSMSAYAERKISGTVLSVLDDEPLVGATVLPLPLGSGNGTATDVDGKFTLNVPATCHEIQVSFVGLQTRDVRITNGPMVIHLSESENRLEEVMVVAYGTAKRSEFTGSASVVKADAIQDALVTSVTSVLQGKVSGVQSLSSDGRPGGAPSIRVRGVGSIYASTSPLYVVDGMPFDGSIADLSPSEIESMTVLKDAASTALYGARGANGVILITTKRGAAGAAKITLDARWGANHRAIPNYNVIQSPQQYSELVYQGYYNQNIGMGMSPAAAWQAAAQKTLQIDYDAANPIGYKVYTVPEGEYLIGMNGKINPNATLGYSDGQYFYTPDNWLDNTIKDGLRQEYNFSISGGNDRIKYYVAANYLGDEGIIKASNFNRFSTRSTIDYQAKTWLKIGANINYTYTRSNYPDSNNLEDENSSSSGNAFYLANRIAPIYPMFVRSADGQLMYNSATGLPVYDYGDKQFSTNFTRNWLNMANPVGSLYYDTSKTFSDVFDAKWYAIVTPIDGLTVTANAGYWISNDRQHIINNPFYGQSAASKGFAEQYFSRSRSITLQALASYTRTFNLDHTIDLMVGYETYSNELEYAAAYGYNLYNPNGWWAQNTIDKKDGDGARPITYTTRGILARAKYNYQNRYFFHASYRRDSSSRFHPDKRWGDFFSVSAAWDIAREEFMEDVTAVDQLKFKVSFGQNGNDNLGTYDSKVNPYAYYYAWADQYHASGADGVWNDATLTYKGNKDLTWEKSNAFNIGFDYSFFEGKLSGSLEYYQRQVSDMLFSLPAAPSLGYDSYPANVGSIRNYGVELEVNYNIFASKDFTWSINANLTTAGNKIIKLPAELIADGSWIDGSRIFKEGKSVFNMYLPSWAGVDEATGAPLWWARYTDEYMEQHPEVTEQEFKTGDYLLARNGKESAGVAANRKETGNLMPKVYGGFGTSVYFKGIDFSISFAYQAGGRIYDNSYAALMHAATTENVGQNYHVDILNAWTPTNTHTDVPRINSADTYSGSISDRFLISSNFLSLNNITLGYTLPSKWTRTLGIESVRVYGAAENLALWSKRKGLDPRQSYTASNNATYSPIRTISGGLRVTF